ncbi:MAG: membrane protein insertase YidC [Akkermansia sp.]
MDRKAWIIVVACLALLGANIYYSGQASKVEQAGKAPDQFHQKEVLPANATSSQSVSSVAPQAGLVVPPRPVNKDVKTWELVSHQKGKDGKATPMVRYTFTNIGGSIRDVQMVGSSIDSRKVPDKDVRINESQSYGIGTLVFGISSTADPIYDTSVYTRVDDGKDPSKICLLGELDNGLVIHKEYSLDFIKDALGDQLLGSKYMLRLKVTVGNKTEKGLAVSNMGVFAGASYPIAKSEMADAFTHFFFMDNGRFEQETPSYFTSGFFNKERPRVVDTAENLTYAGVMSQYFVTILIPDDTSRGNSIYAQRQLFHLKNESNHEVAGVILSLGAPAFEVLPRQDHVLNYEIYAGPKLNQVLGELPHEMNAVMAYGWFTFLSAPMNWLLNMFHQLVGNWGIAIICMTLVVRGLIWPLHKKSYMAMKRMSLVQPKLAELKEKYPNDPQKVNVEMMKMYQQYGINPASGCLPMLVQIPIFFAFYRVLQYSSELRGQPFFGWINDLSLPDTVCEIPLPFDFYPQLPLNILPLIMAITMIIQMKMTPQAGDKMQQRIMKLMPWMFFLFCYNFASALALYWTTQNLISMGQNLLIKRMPMPELKKVKKKKGFMQRMMEQQKATLEKQQKVAKQQNGGMRNVTPKKKS